MTKPAYLSGLSFGRFFSVCFALFWLSFRRLAIDLVIKAAAILGREGGVEVSLDVRG